MPATRRLSDYLDTGTTQADPWGLGGSRSASAITTTRPDPFEPGNGSGDPGFPQPVPPRTDYVGPTAANYPGMASAPAAGGYDANGNRIYGKPTGIAGILKGQVGSQNLLYQQLYKLLASDGHDTQGLNRQIGEIGHGTDSYRQGQAGAFASRGLGNSGLAHALDAAAASGGVEQVSNARAAENSQAMQRRIQIEQLAEEMLTGRRMTARGQDQAVNAAKAGRGKDSSGWMGILGSLLGAGAGTDWSKLFGGGKGKTTGGNTGGGTWPSSAGSDTPSGSVSTGDPSYTNPDGSPYDPYWQGPSQ